MKPIIDFFLESYYTLPLMMASQLVAVYVSYRGKTLSKELKYFYLYPIASFCQSIFALISITFLNQKMEARLLEISVDIFVLIEIYLFYTLFLKVIIKNTFRRILKASIVGFALYTIGLFGFSDSLYGNSMKVVIGETFILFISIFLYFIELFKSPVKSNAVEQPEFWIIIGILFAFSCTLPVIALAFFRLGLISDSYHYIINFVGYSILFLFITRAYLCRKQDEVSVVPKYKVVP
jgi:hypothetical protein